MGCPPKEAFYFSKSPPSAGVKKSWVTCPPITLKNSEQVFYVLYPRVSFHIDKMIFFISYNEFVLYFLNYYYFHHLL
jgi:hypothetical protein